ncbi:MAG TPA: glycoside hydrolase [Azospirillaceae bacterium]|nr:glycoside hydrolase [Azospirillaceae bacterium]
MTRVLTFLAVLLLVTAANFALWFWPNRPVTLEPPPGGKLLSVSFAPFRDGQSPLTKVYPTREQIDEDLRVIKDQVAGVRTYTSLEGMQHVPELAGKYGLKVTQGAWLGRRLDLNENEIASVIELANKHPDTITRVVIGNEVLLRKDLTPEQLKGYIRRVKAAVKQPVTYADVWEFWLKYPEIAQEVDFVTIHLLPYWEDIPVGTGDAAERVLDAWEEIHRAFPDKPILVGEAGWPTAGRTRGPAETGLIEKARFVSLFTNLAAKHDFDYNLIEAFDQNWKAKLEGTVGGHWGLYSVDRKAKFDLSAPVVDNPRWPIHFALSNALALAILLVVGRFGPPLRPAGFLAVALLTQGLCSAFVHAAAQAVGWNYYLHDVAQAVMLLGLELAVGAAVLVAAVRLYTGPGKDWPGFIPAEQAGTEAGAWRLSFAPGAVKKSGFLKGGGLVRCGHQALLALGIYGVAWNALLVFDGRYRDFPNPDYAIPVAGLLALGFLRWLSTPRQGGLAAFSYGLLLTGGRLKGAGGVPRTFGRAIRMVPWDAAIAGVLAVGAIGIVIAEGPLNIEAWTWAAMQLAWALPFAATVGLAWRGAEPR